jgi:hypothetical protein
MARSRNIKPGFFTNELLAEMPHAARLLFIGIWCLADREGRLEDRPIQIKMKLFAADEVASSVIDGYLTALHQKGFIYRYTDGRTRLIQIVEWKKHQNPHHREQPSTLPSPESLGLDPRSITAMPEALVVIDAVKASGISLNEACGSAANGVNGVHKALGSEAVHATPAVLIPDSLIPDSLIQRSLSPKSAKVPKVKPVPERFEEFWKLYPRRVAKVDALKAFAKLSATDAALAIEAAPKHVKQWNDEARDISRIPYPATWLNGQAWNDELMPIVRQPRHEAPKQSRQAAIAQALLGDPRYAQTAANQSPLALRHDRSGPADAHATLAAISAGPRHDPGDGDGMG